MKVDLSNFSEEDIKNILDNKDITLEEMLEQEDIKKKKKEIENKNTRNIMRR